MDQTTVYVFGQLLAAQARIEAMKMENEIARLKNIPVPHGPEAFYSMESEFHNITNQLFR